MGCSAMVSRVRSVANVVVVSVAEMVAVKHHRAPTKFKMEVKMALIVVALAH